MCGCGRLWQILLVAVALGGTMSSASAQTKPTTLFLDKSPKIVKYQLRRLSNEQLLAIQRIADDPRYIPVYQVMLTRPQLAREFRYEALTALQRLTETPETKLLIDAISSISANPANARLIDELTQVMIERPDLQDYAQLLRGGLLSRDDHIAPSLAAGLVTAVGAAEAWDWAASQRETETAHAALTAVLDGIRFLPSAVRDELLAGTEKLLTSVVPMETKKSALAALALIPAQPNRRFESGARFLDSDELRPAAARLLLSIPPKHRDAKRAPLAIETIYAHLQRVPVERRTADDFLVELECAYELAALLEPEQIKRWREALGQISVRVVRIGTLFDQMKYDKAFFVVQQNEQVQIIFRNNDLMPHNLVIARPGSLRKIGAAAAKLLPTQTAKPYVPDLPSVLHATDMLQAGEQTRLTFTAPNETGNFVYLCTFPNHWFRMYGVMVVVDDLNGWLANPVEPPDPLGIRRKLVRNWQAEDFADFELSGVEEVVQQGALVFNEAGCAKCHKVRCEGAAVGPDLDAVFSRFEHDRFKVLREILDPSYQIKEEHLNYSIATADGGVLSGVIVNQDEKSVTIVSNPEDPRPVTIQRSEIDEISRLPTSLMPRGLLDRFAKDEIVALMSFLAAAAIERGQTTDPDSLPR